ncbi:MAG: hypothetical protein ACYS30_19980 [Planctomycetota bacterium]|jgi:hypothetical protein
MTQDNGPTAASVNERVDKLAEILRAVEVWHDAYIQGALLDLLDAEETLANAWERFAEQVKPLPCGICHRLECSH